MEKALGTWGTALKCSWPAGCPVNIAWPAQGRKQTRYLSNMGFKIVLNIKLESYHSKLKQDKFTSKSIIKQNNDNLAKVSTLENAHHARS